MCIESNCLARVSVAQALDEQEGEYEIGEQTAMCTGGREFVNHGQITTTRIALRYTIRRKKRKLYSASISDQRSIQVIDPP